VAAAAADVTRRRTLAAAAANAVLAAAAPHLMRASARAALAAATSTWHLEVTRGQRDRLEALAETCDGLAAAAAEAAEAAAAVELQNAELGDRADALGLALAAAEHRAEAWEERAAAQTVPQIPKSQTPNSSP
jgi:hypothetical protein